MIRELTSASNLHRRKACPGSARLEAGLPDEDNDQSREGTLLHGFDANPELDRKSLKPYHQDLLKISLDLDEQVLQRACEQFDIPGHDKGIEGREKFLIVHDPPRVGKELITGHCDRWALFPTQKVLVIIDKKFGYRVVTPAVANLQLRVYAIAGLEESDCDHVLVAITQPRLPFAERLTMALYSRDDIARARVELKSILDESAKPDAPLNAGLEQCCYCKAKLICPAYKERFLSIALIAPPGDRILAECTDDQLDHVLVAIQFADHIKEQARDEARRRVAAGQLKNWTLGKPVKTREVADTKRAVSLMVLRGALSKDDLFDCAKLSIRDMEELVRKRTGSTWKRAKEIVDETLASVIERGEKKPSLTRI